MAPRSSLLRPLSRPLASVTGWSVGIIRAIAFWSAVLFPLIYVGGYLAIVVDPDLALPSIRVLATVTGVNLLAVFLGHGYEGASPRPPTDGPGAPERSPTGD